LAAGGACGSTRRESLTASTTAVWNPETDPHIAANFSADDMSGKRECKIDLLRRFGCRKKFIVRSSPSSRGWLGKKGYDLIKQISGSIVQTGAFFIALGAAPKSTKTSCNAGTIRIRARSAFIKVYAGEPLAHQIEAGADIFLMPSLYEPCGLNQMYSMRYANGAGRAGDGWFGRYGRAIQSRGRNGQRLQVWSLQRTARCLKKYAKPFTFMAARTTGKRFSAMECW
jgi:hypothetical protein